MAVGTRPEAPRREGEPDPSRGCNREPILKPRDLLGRVRKGKVPHGMSVRNLEALLHGSHCRSSSKPPMAARKRQRQKARLRGWKGSGRFGGIDEPAQVACEVSGRGKLLVGQPLCHLASILGHCLISLILGCGDAQHDITHGVVLGVCLEVPDQAEGSR